MRITYPISAEYVQHWGIWEAAREFIQNGIDAGGLAISYDESTFDIVIENDGDIPRECLLLGKSVKPEEALGKFGEGMKLAMLVCARMERRVCVQTLTERWTAGFAPAEGFESKMFYIDIEENHPSPRVSVRMELAHVGEYQQISNKILEDRTPRVLNDRRCGLVYVGGLYVCHLKGLTYSYNLSAASVALNRDRDLPSMIDVQFEAAKMLGDDELLDAAEAGKADVHPNAAQFYGTSKLRSAFMRRYPGVTPIGISEQGKIEAHKVRIVPDWLAKCLRAAGTFIVRFLSNLSPEQRLAEWEQKYRHHLPVEAREELSDIIAAMRKDHEQQAAS